MISKVVSSVKPALDELEIRILVAKCHDAGRNIPNEDFRRGGWSPIAPEPLPPARLHW